MLARMDQTTPMESVENIQQMFTGRELDGKRRRTLRLGRGDVQF
jgi:hypothetical protein